MTDDEPWELVHAESECRTLRRAVPGGWIYVMRFVGADLTYDSVAVFVPSKEAS